MNKSTCLALTAAMAMSIAWTASQAQEAAPKPTPFKDQLRMPWTRGGTDFIRDWVVTGPLACKLDEDCLGGEATIRPRNGDETKRPDGSTTKWRVSRPWGDYASTDGENPTPDKIAYAFANIHRDQAGKATLSLGSVNALRAWVNGKQVLVRNGERWVSPDNDLVDVELKAGDNALLLKLASDARFIARVLAPGAVPDRSREISASLVESAGDAFSVVTDVSTARAAAEPVTIEAVKAGGEVAFKATAKRGEKLRIDASRWSDGPYDLRFSTTNARGLRYTTHLPWYKGESLPKARELAAEAAKADATSPEGITLRMLARMVDARLKGKVAEATGNPWGVLHSPLLEFDELMLERAGKTGRVRPHGFLRLAWVDETDGTPQFCRAYLPGGYDAAKRWPLVLQLHGYNPANPDYWDWWSADNRHGGPETDFAGNQGVVYIEPHGRGNTQYQVFGDADVMRCMKEARAKLSIDENRTYLTGDSMGGWGTWNVSTRHPEVFAAIAPIFGGVDYHSTMSDEDAARLTPFERFQQERGSSWAMADSLINTPVFIHHGDADGAVNVEWSRWGVRLMQRWGYDVRYREYPGKVHEALQSSNGEMNIDWMLRHVRNPDPLKVRIRSAELRNAQAWWARVQQAWRPLEFMLVDAEVVDRNVIRLDTDNVVDIVLTPSAKLIDVSKPVRVVWNGTPRELRVNNGELRLTDAAYKPGALRKSPSLPGGTYDVFNTPFALVIGTTSKDAAMRDLVNSKTQEFVRQWKDWQKFEPRVFKDTEISDADIARYSLLLIGGPGENAVTAKLAAKLPLKLSADRIVIDGKSFAAKDAGIQLLYPNPRNAQRYVWLYAGTSLTGMNLAPLSPYRVTGYDFIIDDGHAPAPGVKASPEKLNVVTGSFDQNWRLNPAYLQAGDAELRAKGRLLVIPSKKVSVPVATLDSLVGKYLLPGGNIAEVTRDGDGLQAKAGPDLIKLQTVDDMTYYAAQFNVWLTFVKDESGQVTRIVGFQSGEGDFEAKRQ